MTALTSQERADVEAIIPRIQALTFAIFGARSYPGFDQRDVLQSALEGVCKARKNWDPDRGAAWSTHAITRARGAILDFLRSERPGTRANPAENPTSLDAFITRDDDLDPLDRIGYTEDPEPHDHHLERQLFAAIDDLPGHQGAAFRLHAEAELTMVEIADIIGVTESRVSQLVKAAREHLAPIASDLLEPVAA